MTQCSLEELTANLHKGLETHGFVASQDLSTTLALMSRLERPLLVEGEPGVGKTAIAAALAKYRNTELIRIQCFEGIDASSALFEWNYAGQLLAIKLNENQDSQLQESDLYQERYLLERPLLKSIRQPVAPVLLIDEVDRSDEAFEAFLLEVLSEFSVSIPEIGTIEATTIPLVILTSNGSRELSDALRRRCLYHYASYPNFERERLILNAHLPNLNRDLTDQIVRFVQLLRKHDLEKRPGIAESLDWAQALYAYNIEQLGKNTGLLASSLSCLIKTKEDQNLIQELGLGALLEQSNSSAY